MAPHSSTLAWKIPWTEEPGRLQSMGSLKVGQDWATSLSLFTFMHWRRKWQPTPVFLPGESQGQGSLVGCRLWSHTELDTTEVTYQQQQQHGLPKRCWFNPSFRKTPLEKGVAAHSSFLAWRSPMDRGGWRATVHRVTKSQTQLKQLNVRAHTHTHRHTHI